MSPKRFKSTLIIAVLLAALPLLGPDSIRPSSALPVDFRTIGLFIDSSGWSYSGSDTNPPITVYENTEVTVFLQSQDSSSHQLVINTTIPITSPIIPPCCPSEGIVLFTFTASPVGIFSYCDVSTGACGTFQVKKLGDVDGNGDVDPTDIDTIISFAGAVLPSGWNSGDEPYPDGRVDITDLLVVSYFFERSNWTAPYDPDVNEDGVVNILDLSTVASNVGASSAPPFDHPNQGPDVNYDNRVDNSDVPPSADIDGDGIPDHVELSPEMQALGADPCRKTIAVEVDYMVSGDHTHRPKPEGVDMVVAAFDAAPVPTVGCPYATFPRRPTGIGLIVDIDDALPEQVPLNFSQGSPDTFESIKATHFDLARVPYFHYSLWVHDLAVGSSVSGISDFHGNDFIVSLGSWTDRTGTTLQQAGTFMHELGHNLGLHHGGRDGVNFKPNYLSVMNYAFQTVGIKGADGTSRLGYSSAMLATLDEISLVEAAGIGPLNDYTSWSCTGKEAELTGLGNSGLDWNCNGPIDPLPVSSDINGDRVCIKPGDNGTLESTNMGDDQVVGSRIHDGANRTCESTASGGDEQVRPIGSPQPSLLEGFDDWNAIDYVFRDNPENYPGHTTVETGHTMVETGKELTFEEAQVIESFWAEFSSLLLTESFSTPLRLDSQGNPKVDVFLAYGVVTSTDPSQVTLQITVTNGAGSSVSSLRLVETLPVDWRLSSFDPQVRVYFESPGQARVPLTTGVSISVEGSPQTVSLTIPDFSATAAGKMLDPGERIIVFVNMDYALKGTMQQASNYPIPYSATATATVYSDPRYEGTGVQSYVSIFFVAHAVVFGGGGGGGRVIAL